MPNSHFVRKVLEALDEVEVLINTKTKPKDQQGRPILAWYNPEIPTVTIYRRNHKSFDDLCVSLLHETFHHIKNDLPEYLIDEGLDRAAFTSPKLRWAAAEKIGTVLLKF